MFLFSKQADSASFEKEEDFRFDEFVPHFETPVQVLSFSAKPFERWLEKEDQKVILGSPINDVTVTVKHQLTTTST